MGGRSGSVMAVHTPRVKRARGEPWGSEVFAVSVAQRRIVDRAIAKGGACFLRGGEVRSARLLVSLSLATLTDDGNMKIGSRVDGERWTLTLADGVT